MFCCTQNPTHEGQIVTSICQDSQCIKKQVQMCCAICIRDHHSSHIKQVSTMKEILPELLNANNVKNYYEGLLQNLCTFIQQEFGNDEFVRSIVANTSRNAEGGRSAINFDIVTEIIPQIMLNLKKINREENKKIREIEKTLHSQNPQMAYQPQSQVQQSKLSVGLNFPGGNKSSPIKVGTSKFETVPMTVSQLVGNMDTYCHTMKHPYVSLSPDSHTAWKNTQANGYKLGAISAGSISIDMQNYFYNVKVQKSSGNILLGLAIPEIVKHKQYLNTYGSTHGTFLMGQNGNDPKSAIIFHHCDNMFNRKEIVGWNYRQGDVLGVGLIKDNGRSFVSFRMYNVNSSGKVDKHKVAKQFTMPLGLDENSQYQRLHFMALMQKVGDSVTILPCQE